MNIHSTKLGNFPEFSSINFFNTKFKILRVKVDFFLYVKHNLQITILVEQLGVNKTVDTFKTIWWYILRMIFAHNQISTITPKLGGST